MARRPPMPLVVDADGGLFHADPVACGLRHCLWRRPGASLRALRSHPVQPAFALQQILSAPGVSLPAVRAHPVVLDAARTWARFGVPVIVISHLPERMLGALRDSLALDATVFGARPGRPLGPADKAAFLVSVFGEHGFDLIAAPNSAAAFHARRALIPGLDRAGKQRLASHGVRAKALPRVPVRGVAVRLRAGPGWEPDWTDARADQADTGAAPGFRPGTRPPIRDASDAGRSRTGRAGRS